jgi:predicted site-specific integrase-resolvase
MSAPTSVDDEVLRPRQVAEMYDLHYQTVMNHIHNGLLPAVKRGGRWYTRRKWLKEYMPDDAPRSA